MAVVSEDGTGIEGAEIYGVVEDLDTYWDARSHDAFSAAWSGLNSAQKEGCAREATTWLDANFGNQYRGQRKSYSQGLMWPRHDGLDEDGVEIALTDINGAELPSLPVQLKTAVAELVKDVQAGAISKESSQAAVKSVKVGDVATEFAEGASASVSISNRIGLILSPVLSSPGGGSWDWR